MTKNDHDLVINLHREAIANESPGPKPNADTPTVHHSDLPEANAGSPLCHEWNVYRREVARLLAEGNEGRHVLIKHKKIIGIWDSHEEAMAAGYKRFLGQPFLVHQIQERERIERCITFRPNCRTPKWVFEVAS